MAAKRIDAFSHGTRSLTIDFLAIHLSIAHQVLGKNLVQFLSPSLFIQLQDLHVNFCHLKSIFAQGSLIEKGLCLTSIGTIDQIGILITLLQQVCDSTFTEK